MVALRLLPLLGIIGCMPATVDGSSADGLDAPAGGIYESIDSTGSDSLEDDSGDPDGSDSDGSDSDGSNSSDDGTGDSGLSDDADNEEAIALRSGEYYFQTFELVEDPCSWEAVLGDSFSGFLPDSFIVAADERGFDIEAQRIDTNYGVENSVRCTLEGNDFSCDMQDVSPSKGLLGQYGWSYEVTFTGVVESEQILRGTSVVRFIVTPFGLSTTGLSADTDTALCTQVLDMTIRRGNAG